MIRGETGRDKILFSFQQGQTANSRTAIAGFLALSAPRRQISGHLSASGSNENQTDSDIFHLSCTFSYLLYILYASYICTSRTSRTSHTSCTSCIWQSSSVLVHPPLSGDVLLRQ